MMSGIFLDGVLPANWPCESVAGLKITETGYSHWQTTIVLVTNISVFTALPNGGFEEIADTFLFVKLGTYSNFWTSSSFGDVAWTCSV